MSERELVSVCLWVTFAEVTLLDSANGPCVQVPFYLAAEMEAVWAKSYKLMSPLSIFL